MAIIATDVKIYESERMTEEPDGGGIITGNTVVCSELNAVFPNISRIDRLYGRTQFRKIFPKIISPGTNTYSGSHFIVSEAPTDENIGIIMFDTGTKDDEHSDMISYFESYYEIGPKCGTATLAYQAEIGSTSLVFQTEVVNKHRVYEVDDTGVGRWFWIGTSVVYSLPVTPGEVVCIENGGNYEFVHVIKVEVQREYSPENQFVNRMKYVTYTILYLSKPTSNLHAVGVSVYSKQINPLWHCYGTMRLSEAVAPGATSLPVVSEKVRVMPTVSLPVETAEYPVYPSSTLANDVVFGILLYQITLSGVPQPYVSESRAVTTGQSVYVHITTHRPIAADSLTIRYRAQNKWRLISEFTGVLQGDGAGSIDLTNGVISFNTNFVPDESTHFIFQYKSEASYEEHLSTTIGSPGSLPVALNFGTENVIPGSVFFDITTTSGTYHIMVDSLGKLRPDFRRFLVAPDFNDVEYKTSTTGGTGMTQDSKIQYGFERYWWWSRHLQHQSTSTNGKTWSSEAVEDVGFDMAVKRLAFSTRSNKAMMMIGGSKILRRFGHAGTWVDISANKPVPGDSFNDIVFWRDSFGAPNGGWLAVTNSSPYKPIVSYDDGSTWNYFTTTQGPYPMSRIAIGTVGYAYVMMGASSSTAYVLTDRPVEKAYPQPLFNLGQDCIDIACSGSTWIILGKTDMKIIESFQHVRYGNPYSLIQALPEVAGRDMVSVAASTDGKWVITFDNTGLKEYVAISGDDGRHWAVYDPDNGSWGDANNSSVSNVCYDGLNRQFVWLQQKAGASSEYFRTSILKINEYPFDLFGTVDYAAGTGEITTGEEITESITANLFLSSFDYKTFAFPLMTTPPIQQNSIEVTAKQDNTAATPKSISEVGGSIVGDGTMTINHEHGYVYGEFDVPVQPDSITAKCSGTSLYHPEYDEYDSSRMPTDGLVPACKEGDTLVVSDGVNYDACIVTKVTKQKINIAVESGLANGYAAGTLVSAAVVGGDLQALEGNYFTDSTWTGWFDSQQTGPAGGTWDDINYPATVANNSCITERWSIEVTQAAPTTLVKVTGEAVGIVTTNFNLHAGPDLAPTNGIAPRGGQLYLYYDGGTVLATVGETITGADSSDTAVIDEILGDATSGMLIVSACSVGDFQDNEIITGGTSMVAVTNCASVQAFSSTYFNVPAAAWSANGTFTIGDVFRFNTSGTEVPLWVLRSLNARTSDTATDDFVLETRGDTA